MATIADVMDSLENQIEGVKKALNQPLSQLTADELGQVAYIAQQIAGCDTQLTTAMPPFVASMITGPTTAVPVPTTTTTDTPTAVAGTLLAGFAASPIPQPSVTPSSPATPNTGAATPTSPGS